MSIEIADETRTPMTWERYESLDVRGEYLGGHLVVSAFPVHRHQDICFRMAKLLEASAPRGARMVQGWGWAPVGAREELGPDLMVHTSPEETRLTQSAPLLVVEVLSSHRRTDLVEKSVRYARWGAAAYWVVDPRDHELVTYVLDDGVFRQTAVHATGVVTASYGPTSDSVDVEIDVDALLG